MTVIAIALPFTKSLRPLWRVVTGRYGAGFMSRGSLQMMRYDLSLVLFCLWSGCVFAIAAAMFTSVTKKKKKIFIAQRCLNKNINNPPQPKKS